MRTRYGLVGMLVVAVLSALVTGVPSAPAAVTPDHVGQSSQFPPGGGSGSARVGTFVVRSSGVSVVVTGGKAIASYRGAQGNAEATAVDLGLLETLATSPIACGFALKEVIPLEQLPPPTKVSSGSGPATEESVAFGEGSPLQFGRQHATAAPNARGAADVEAVSFDLAGVVQWSGGTASAQATLVPGTSRTAQSHSEVGRLSLAGGLVRLEGLVWDASHTTGEDHARSGTFSISGMTIAGLPVPTGTPEQIRAALARANAVLATVGLELAGGEVTETDAGVTVTPLRLTITPIPELVAVLAPVLDAIQPGRTLLLDLLEPFSIDDGCGAAKAVGFGYLVADLVLMAASSGGGIDILLGGVTAGTDDRSFESPFQFTVPPPASAPVPTVAPATTTAPPPPPSTTSTTPTAVTEEVAAPVVNVAPIAQSRCVTSHPVGRPACSAGAGTIAGVLGLLVVGGLAVADRIRSRRS